MKICDCLGICVNCSSSHHLNSESKVPGFVDWCVLIMIDLI